MIVVSLDIFWTMFQLTGGERLRERHVHHIVLEVGYRYPRGAGAAGGDMDCMKASSSSDCAAHRGLRQPFFCRTATIMDLFFCRTLGLVIVQMLSTFVVKCQQ